MRDPVELLSEVAERHPDQAAVESGEIVTTYGEFAGMVRGIAAAIDLIGEQTADCRVLIRLPRGAEAYAAMFGALLAGAYYSPLNMDHPAASQQRQIDRFAPTLVIGDTAEIAGSSLEIDVPVIDPTSVSDAPNFEVRKPSQDLAYVIFTSGSTGEPKGVMIPRVALAHYVEWIQSVYRPGPSDRWSQHPNLGFDLSVMDIYGALCSGATLVSITDRRERLVPAAAIQNRNITIWNSVPSVVDLMRRGGKMTGEALASLRLMTFCGEPLLREHLDAIFEARPDLEVFNTYGPTEATVSVTQLRLDSTSYRKHCRESVAIGEPIPGMHILLEGGEHEGEGEIVIAGPQVARGYWQDDALTTQQFCEREVRDALLPAYRTGDWVARIGDDVYFASRIDRQIKINGYRLELSSVEAALRDAGAAAASVVFHREQLVAFAESNESTLRAEDLLMKIANQLPAYAVPRDIRLVDHLPRNANDKIDAGALMSQLEEE